MRAAFLLPAALASCLIAAPAPEEQAAPNPFQHLFDAMANHAWAAAAAVLIPGGRVIAVHDGGAEAAISISTASYATAASAPSLWSSPRQAGRSQA
ncbi:MAG: hypothetical protein KGN84_01740 [Acidobacteriota bacterium]|nr:hypothetical protein [Acidobacteriota bacterium]